MISKLQVAKPIIQAPMAGITTPKFVAACCEAGALGSVGAGYLNGAETKTFIQAVKALTDKASADIAGTVHYSVHFFLLYI